MNAARLNHQEAVKVLIEQGAKIDATSEHNLHPGRQVDALELASEG